MIGILKQGVAYFCVATVIAQALCVGWLISQGNLTGQDPARLAAVFYGIPWPEEAPQDRVSKAPVDHEDLARGPVRAFEVAMELDLDMRDAAVEHGLNDFDFLQRELAKERQEYEIVYQEFKGRYDRMQRVAAADSITQLQQTLSALRPRQAKDQIMRTLRRGESAADLDARRDVVTILKAMPIERRKRIIGEFRSTREQEKLAELLRDVRLGRPEVTLIEGTRKLLNRFPIPNQE